MNLLQILLVLAAVCFAFEAFTDVRSSRINLVAAGLLFWVFVLLLQTINQD